MSLRMVAVLVIQLPVALILVFVAEGKQAASDEIVRLIGLLLALVPWGVGVAIILGTGKAVYDAGYKQGREDLLNSPMRLNRPSRRWSDWARYGAVLISGILWLPVIARHSGWVIVPSFIFYLATLLVCLGLLDQFFPLLRNPNPRGSKGGR